MCLYFEVYGKANVCAYDGGYYCYECHTDDEAIIPAKILYSWDFRKHKGTSLLTDAIINLHLELAS